MGTRTNRTITKIEGMVDALNECGNGDIVLFDREESEILICVLEEAIKALYERRDSG